MTVRAKTQAADGARRPEPSHPLQRLGADEIRRARTLLASHGLVGEHTRFAYLGLEEPPKGEVLAFRPGRPVERRVRAILLDTATGARCRPGRSASRARRAGACSGCSPSCSVTRRTTRGRIRSTAWSPTSTSSSAGCCT